MTCEQAKANVSRPTEFLPLIKRYYLKSVPCLWGLDIWGRGQCLVSTCLCLSADLPTTLIWGSVKLPWAKINLVTSHYHFLPFCTYFTTLSRSYYLAIQLLFYSHHLIISSPESLSGSFSSSSSKVVVGKVVELLEVTSEVNVEKPAAAMISHVLTVGISRRSLSGLHIQSCFNNT